MERVLIIGSSGSGKSTLSRRLGEITGLPVVHLDRLYWRPGWKEPAKDEWKAIIAEAVKGGRWIMDGNYSGTLAARLPHCDTVIFLDMPRALCIYRILKRVALRKRTTRPDMADGCEESLNIEFLKWVWGYPVRSKPKVESLIRSVENTITVVRLTAPREVEKFLKGLPAKAYAVEEK